VNLSRLKKLGEEDSGLERELTELFIPDTEDRLKMLDTALKTGDTKAFVSHAHARKGVCVNFGATRLQKAVGQLERFALKRKLGQAPSIMTRVQCDLERVRDHLIEGESG